ncbi:unnamed protein product [Mytilus edulis]|uniref:Uncharacterized protein n=1 Tax=Mytilus edulis TaxID=6550 RepID=A0A8S3QC39_MYTED|nr:unnamed protein product [Mytilus edulis]
MNQASQTKNHQMKVVTLTTLTRIIKVCCMTVTTQKIHKTDNNLDNETPETNLNQKQTKTINFQNEYNHYVAIKSNETESDRVNADDINQMTSTIIKSSLQLNERKHNDMLAFCWLWDFAGQKDFYATHQVFLSNCAVYLLVTDSLDFTTTEEPGINFEDSTQYVRFWFDAIHCYWSTTKRGQLDPPIIVVCTNEDKFKIYDSLYYCYFLRTSDLELNKTVHPSGTPVIT